MPGIAEMGAYGMLRDDWGSAYLITRTPGTARPYRAERRDDHAALEAATPDELRTLIRANYEARPVPRDVAP